MRRYRFAVPLPKELPEVTLFPSAEALVDGVPVPELIGQVAPWGTGACLVEDGFDEHPVAEDRGAAGGVFEFAQDRLDFGLGGIRDEKTQGYENSPKKRASMVSLSISREFINTP